MNEENNVQAENSTQAEEVVLETTDEAVEETTENVEDYKARLAKAEELANNYKVRAEKAERKAKESGKVETKSETNDSLSTKDLYALVEAKVAEDDVTEVEQFAKFKGISISEALKTSTLKAILQEKNENRRVAQASNTGTARRSSTKASDEVLAEKASKGELPDSQDDLVRLIRARKGIKS